MYAIISDRSRQATVRPGDILLCDLDDEVGEGDTITFDRVLLVGDEGQVRVGTPALDDVTVTGEVLGRVKGPKLVAFRFKRRKGVRRKRGHRQSYTQVRITKIGA